MLKWRTFQFPSFLKPHVSVSVLFFIVSLLINLPSVTSLISFSLQTSAFPDVFHFFLKIFETKCQLAFLLRVLTVIMTCSLWPKDIQVYEYIPRSTVSVKCKVYHITKTYCYNLRTEMRWECLSTKITIENNFLK